ncbi:hypothetical protein LTR99_007141 [Exophiala xenobiotica]|uniref:Uncharacterized protein n=1 Tax=Vermiconidia calcicola TaxID=1690605 RepID=A0AAV9PSW0_9PEZI|nr:hypothetical protein LTR96_005403 [Exophiala xenobiotica]KAK5528933.1 hypothetical protein LTR25_010118 [Vermiconidia calcicola]KAK5544900.1 hypothetical protein LTR23_004029 [Chaetothyriales sp. CCFEE 6169]KAK5300392.1 hypothetical protein LTR99_007141 [Exophiala xenobiotica]KAK5334226.1 hypothetical protein LTR98_009689 [Exophiala xenobiotica]
MAICEHETEAELPDKCQHEYHAISTGHATVPNQHERLDERSSSKCNLRRGGTPRRCYTFRRPGFLRNFSNREYGEIAQHLSQQASRVPTAKEAIEHVTGRGKILQAVVRHAIWWVEPTWTVPANVNASFHSTYMVRVVRNCYQQGAGHNGQGEADSLLADPDVLTQNQAAGGGLGEHG